MFDVVTLGELLIDFTPVGNLFEPNPGGGAANVAVAAQKLGAKAGFIGKVGRDQFGKFLISVLKENSVETKGVVVSDEFNTTLAFVHLDEAGDRSFSFYRTLTADAMLAPEEVNLKLIDETKIFHFTALSMTTPCGKEATLKAVEYARQKGKIISYDPNWRPFLWKDEKEAVALMKENLSLCNIVKISDEELLLLTGQADVEAGSEKLLEMGVSLVLVTLGKLGCYYRFQNGAGRLDTYDTKVVDTTGCGDTFLGAVLTHVSRFGAISDISQDEMESILDYANAAGSLCATKRGGMSAMPTPDEVARCIKDVPLLVVS